MSNEESFDPMGGDWIETDFLPPLEFNDEDRATWHCNLSVVPNSMLSVRVFSEQLDGSSYIVTHTYGDIEFCQCLDFKFCKPAKYVRDHRWCKHSMRAYLVLLLRNIRRGKEEEIAQPTATPQEKNWEQKMNEAPLTRSEPFSIL
jgi:hypothetical protein